MKSVGLMGLVVILVGVFGGYWVYTATMPEVEEELIEDPSESSDTSQFLQLKPDSVPPVVKMNKNEEDDEVTDDSSKVQGTSDLVVKEGVGQVVNVEVDENGGGNITEIDEQGVIVSMTDLGFVPASVTVGVGTVVTFVNDGQSLHWPASDSHPVHNLLSGFDAEKGISTGGVYSYKFTKEGDWPFHDHLNPDFGGTIVVE